MKSRLMLSLSGKNKTFNNMILLDAEAIKMIGILLLFIFAYPIYGAIIGFVSGQKVRVRGRGIIGHPDTIPNILNYVGRNSKDIYNKIRQKIGDRQLTAITNTSDKLEKLRQLGELKDKQVITDEEFQILKAEVLGIDLDSSHVPPESPPASSLGRVNRTFKQR